VSRLSRLNQTVNVMSVVVCVYLEKQWRLREIGVGSQNAMFDRWQRVKVTADVVAALAQQEQTRGGRVGRLEQLKVLNVGVQHERVVDVQPKGSLRVGIGPDGIEIHSLQSRHVLAELLKVRMQRNDTERVDAVAHDQL